MAAEDFGGFRFRQNGFNERGGLLGWKIGLQNFQRDGLAVIRIRGLVNAGKFPASAIFTQNFESADMVRHGLRLASQMELMLTRLDHYFHSKYTQLDLGESAVRIALTQVAEWSYEGTYIRLKSALLENF